MALLIIILFFLPVFLLLLLQKLRRSKGGVSLPPPGPQGLPLIGNLLQFDVSNNLIYFWNLSKKYGPIFLLHLGSAKVIVISSAKLAKEALKTHDLQISSRPELLGVRILSYNFNDVAFTPYGPYWREMRKTCVVHLFKATRVQQFRPVRENEVSRMIQKISKSVADSSKPIIDLSEVLMSLTCTIICRLAFGKRFEDEEGENCVPHVLIDGPRFMLWSHFISDSFPYLGWIDKFTGLYRRLQKDFKDSDEFYQQLIDEHLDPKRPKPEHEDVMDVLLQLKKDSQFKVDLTWDHIKAVAMNVFVAGTDSSAAAMVWAMTNLMKSPKAMKKVQEEIRHVVKDKGFVDEEDVQELQYLKAVVKETLRLHPPVPVIARSATERCNIDGYEIPAKATVLVNMWTMGRDTEVWGDKANEFNPERFIGNSIDSQGKHFEYLPFGGGRRICPGMVMANSTVELALANILYKFDWEMPHGMKIDDLDFDFLPGITLLKKNPLMLMARNYI